MPRPANLSEIEMNEPELIRAAEATGGKFYTPLTADKLLKDLPPPSKVPLDTDPPIPLWNTWPVLGLFLAADHGGMGFQKTQADGMIFVKDPLFLVRCSLWAS